MRKKIAKNRFNTPIHRRAELLTIDRHNTGRRPTRNNGTSRNAKPIPKTTTTNMIQRITRIVNRNIGNPSFIRTNARNKTFIGYFGTRRRPIRGISISTANVKGTKDITLKFGILFRSITNAVTHPTINKAIRHKSTDRNILKAMKQRAVKRLGLNQNLRIGTITILSIQMTPLYRNGNTWMNSAIRFRTPIVISTRGIIYIIGWNSIITHNANSFSNCSNRCLNRSSEDITLFTGGAT